MPLGSDLELSCSRMQGSPTAVPAGSGSACQRHKGITTARQSFLALDFITDGCFLDKAEKQLRGLEEACASFLQLHPWLVRVCLRPKPCPGVSFLGFFLPSWAEWKMVCQSQKHLRILKKPDL